MDNKEFSKQLEKRTKKFSIQIIELSALLPNTSEARVIKNQITKSGTSVGANYREANRSRSKADFLHKIKICESEASETEYWIELIAEFSWIDSDKVKLALAESNELVAIFTSIGKSLKSTSSA